MNIEKYTKNYSFLTKEFDCGNYVISNFLKSSDALDENQGITYIMLSDEKDNLYHERNSYEDFEDDMSTFVQESDKSCYKLYKWIDDIIEV